MADQSSKSAAQTSAAQSSAAQSPAAQREAARARLRESIDVLGEKASLQVQMQKEPLRMLGGATGVGLALGVLVGRSFKKSKRVYVDAASSKKEQQRLHKIQTQKKAGSLSGALTATIVTLGFKMLQERVLVPKLSEYADKLLSQQGGQPEDQHTPASSAAQPTRPAQSRPVQSSAAPSSAGVQPLPPRPAPDAAEGAIGSGSPRPSGKPDLHKM